MNPILFKSSSVIAVLIVLLFQFLVIRLSVAIDDNNNVSQQKYSYTREPLRRAVGSIVPWPAKVEFSNGTDYLTIDPAIFKLMSTVNCSIVGRAIERYTKKKILNSLLFDDWKPMDRDEAIPIGKRKKLGNLTAILITDGSFKSFSCETIPHINMDEAYELNIQVTGDSGIAVATARLAANSSWGIIRGLETVSQLIFKVNDEWGEFGIQPVSIRDEPRFQHRGFMLDTSRHYISLRKIRRMIDAMAFNKMNVFHWHIVDDQSFPYESITYPDISKRTAFRPGFVYSQADVKSIIDYAAERGIRVLPELDTPGHTFALRFIPNLLTRCYNTTSGHPNGDLGPINPTLLSSYKTISKLLNEFRNLFPDTMLHAGGDEVDFGCWQSNPQVNQWMNLHNMTGNYQELNNYYIKRIYDLVTHYNRTMLVWQEVFDHGARLPNDAVVHVWKYINDRPAYMAELKNVVTAGYKAILSSCWYLNYIDYGQDWVKFYQCDPVSSPIADEEAHLVLGGEVCMWSEFVDDTNVMTRTWPRASAAAERLWSPRSRNNVNDFMNRLEQIRCRMQFRGLEVEPVNGPGYC